MLTRSTLACPLKLQDRARARSKVKIQSTAIQGASMSEMMKWEHGNTWYRVVGDLKNGKTPLMVLHGGPGAGHNYCIPIAELIAQTGRACILYDQIGCGNSTHLPEADKNFWTLGL